MINVSYTVNRANRMFPITLNAAAAIITAAILYIVPSDVLHSLLALLFTVGSR